ncbi:hypothetical protein JCM5350_005998 [Sporobolomyces pararoseus]
MSTQSERPPVKRQYGSRKSTGTSTTTPSLPPPPSSSSSSIATSSSSPLRLSTNVNREWEAALREENDTGKSRTIQATPPTSPGLALPSRVNTRSQSKSPERRKGKEVEVKEEKLEKRGGGDLRNFFTRTTTTSMNKKRRLSTSDDESDPITTTIPELSGCTSMSRQASSDSTSSFSLKRSKQQQPREKRLSQLYLDPFQTPGRSTLSCSVCSLSYSRTPEDINFHTKHHKKIVSGIDFTVQEGAKGVTVLKDAVEWGKGGEEGKVLMIDWVVAENGLKRKLNEVMETIDTELCSTSLTVQQLSESKLFLFVTNKGRKVIACAVVQRIKHAFKVVTPPSSLSSSSEEKEEGLIKFEDDGGGDSSAVFCSPEPLSTILGVHRIWTSTSFRKNGLASLLLDHVASRFVYGCPIGTERRKEDVAFSQPTGKGKELAKRWTGTGEFKVFVD